MIADVEQQERLTAGEEQFAYDPSEGVATDDSGPDPPAPSSRCALGDDDAVQSQHRLQWKRTATTGPRVAGRGPTRLPGQGGWPRRTTRAVTPVFLVHADGTSAPGVRAPSLRTTISVAIDGDPAVAPPKSETYHPHQPL